MTPELSIVIPIRNEAPALRDLQLVVKNGVVYDPAALRRAAGLR